MGTPQPEQLLALGDNNLSLHILLQPGALRQLQPDVLPLVTVVIVQPPLVRFQQHIAGIDPQSLLIRIVHRLVQQRIQTVNRHFGHHRTDIVLPGVMG